MIHAGYNHCRICGGSKKKVFLTEMVTKFNDDFSLKKCDACDFVSIHPLPSDSTLKRYYDQDYWQQEGSKYSPAFSRLYKWRMGNIVSEIGDYTPANGKILDWGCGDGAFIKLLRRYRHTCFGIDAYRDAPADPNIINADIGETNFPDEFFDTITCLHVLEHLDDPVPAVKKALRLLKTGGTMIVEVPNLDSLGFKIFRRKWQPLEIPTHLNHFTPGTLQDLFERIGKTQTLKLSYFSHRVSPSALVLSVFPRLTPRKIRLKNNGHYPLPLMTSYLLLQILAYPFAAFGSLARYGEIVRMYIRKTNR